MQYILSYVSLVINTSFTMLSYLLNIKDADIYNNIAHNIEFFNTINIHHVVSNKFLSDESESLNVID